MLARKICLNPLRVMVPMVCRPDINGKAVRNIAAPLPENNDPLEHFGVIRSFHELTAAHDAHIDSRVDRLP
jgi:hypothetical protein